jgi:hypothetical protein
MILAGWTRDAVASGDGVQCVLMLNGELWTGLAGVMDWAIWDGRGCDHHYHDIPMERRVQGFPDFVRVRIR